MRGGEIACRVKLVWVESTFIIGKRRKEEKDRRGKKDEFIWRREGLRSGCVRAPVAVTGPNFSKRQFKGQQRIQFWDSEVGQLTNSCLLLIVWCPRTFLCLYTSFAGAEHAYLLPGLLLLLDALSPVTLCLVVLCCL